MRAPLYAAVLAAWAALLSSCLAAPSPEDWLAVGYRTPEQTFRTFQTGLRADLPDVEYRCLSADLKHREGVSQAMYREFRDPLFRSQPWLKFAARARIQEVIELAPDRTRIVARVCFLWHRETFAVDLVREDFYELWSAGSRVSDDVFPWEGAVRADDGRLSLAIPLPPGCPPESLDEARVGREWKIDDFPLLEAPDP